MSHHHNAASISPARTTAFDILRDVEGGGYAADLLLARTVELDARDAGLAHQLVFGCLRYQAQLDYLIQFYSGRTQRLDPEVRIALQLGTFQQRYLDRIPRHAAVTESVELVKRARKRSAAGFVNAVLRKVTAETVTWPNREVAFSCPEWLLAKWEREFGRERAEGIATAALHEPETWVRYNAEPPPNLQPTEIPGGYRVISGEPPEGARIQDIGSQSIVPLLEFAPGQTFLDLCAAPGNKTSHALEAGVSAIACDLHHKRIAHVQGCRRVVLNAADPLPFASKFERILTDVPCSGTGTLARNPEIKWRLTAENLSALADLQKQILANALRHLKPGGRLVYSTCSLEIEENQAVVQSVLEEAADVRLVKSIQRIPGRDPGDGFYAAVLALS